MDSRREMVDPDKYPKTKEMLRKKCSKRNLRAQVKSNGVVKYEYGEKATNTADEFLTITSNVSRLVLFCMLNQFLGHN